MATNPYDMLFTDQNLNREFVIQPYTTNGPTSPTGGVDPSAANANTTLYLYGKGAPNYGERIQENLVFMMEHFNNPSEPSFPIPGQIWSNTSVSPPQLYVYNASKYTVVSSTGNTVIIQSTGGLDPVASLITRFSALFTASKSFTIYGPTFVPFVFTQTAAPIQVGLTAQLTVTPVTPVVSMTGYITGGWESIFQSNTVNVMRQVLDANTHNIINVLDPVNPQDAATKAYVDAAVSGGSLTLSSLSDVQFATPGNPQTGAFLQFNGLKWTDTLLSSVYLPLAGGTMLGTLNAGGFTIQGAGNPVNPTDVTNKSYVDNQPLSSQYVIITTPAPNDVLYYNGINWVNATPVGAGLLPLSGGVMAGAINMGGYAITGLPILSTPYPVNPTDAATKAYVDSIVAGSNGITSAIYNNTTGILTINQVASPNVIAVPGFLPTPGNLLASTFVTYVPPDPPTVSPVPGMFFQSTLSDYNVSTPGDIEDPTKVIVNSALAVLDLALGNYTVPRQRLVMIGTGSNSTFNLNTGVPNTVVGGPPGVQFVVGSNGLSIYVNGIKQVAADRGFYKLTSGVDTTTTIPGVTFTAASNTVTVPGMWIDVLRVGVRFATSGTSTTNDGGLRVISVSTVGPNTVVVAEPDPFSATPATVPFVVSGPGTLTYGPFGIMPGMQTGFQFGGAPNPATLEVSVNGNTPVTATIDTATTNCNTFGLLTDAVNAYANAYFMNKIQGVTVGAFGNFIVPGDRVAQFGVGTAFDVRYSTGNDGSYVVGPGVPTYSIPFNQTTIPITTSVAVATVDGVIFQDNWGFSLQVENGSIIFYSNVPGFGSAVVPVLGTLLTGVTGIDWPISITTFAGTTNAFTPQDYAYREIGACGFLSSLVQFAVAPAGPVPGPADTIEFVVDRDMVYSSYNPLLTAVTV